MDSSYGDRGLGLYGVDNQLFIVDSVSENSNAPYLLGIQKRLTCDDESVSTVGMFSGSLLPPSDELFEVLDESNLFNHQCAGEPTVKNIGAYGSSFLPVSMNESTDKNLTEWCSVQGNNAAAPGSWDNGLKNCDVTEPYKHKTAAEAMERYTDSAVNFEGRRSHSLGNSNSKNAIAARDNRSKKKKYMTSLEESVRNLKAENITLSAESEKYRNAVRSLENEVAYLKSVIANQTTLSAILKNVMKTPGIILSTPFAMETHFKRESVKCREMKTASTCAQTDLDDSVLSESNSLMNKVISTPASGRLTRKQAKLLEKCMKVPNKYQIKRNIKKKDQDGKEYLSVATEDLDSSSNTPLMSPSADIGDTGGVCLHVSGHNVSLEFCSTCNDSARACVITDHSYVKK